MKKLHFALLFMLISLPISFAQLNQAESWKSVQKKGKGKLTIIYHPMPRLIYQENNEFKGLCAGIISDFVGYVKSKYNVTLEVDYAVRTESFSQLLSLAETTPNVLGVANVSITEERKKKYKFTPKFMRMPAVIITHKNVAPIGGLAEMKKLNGFSAIVIKGSSYHAAVTKIKAQYLPGLKIIDGISSEKIPQDIQKNPKLFTVLDIIEYMNAIEKTRDIRKHDVDLGYADDLGFIMSKQSDWDVIWNEFLTTEYRNASTYRKRIVENLGPSFLNMVY